MVSAIDENGGDGRNMNPSSGYVITIHSDEQIALLQKVAECFLRERMGQFWDLAEDLAGAGTEYVYDNEDPDKNEKFSAFIRRRDNAEHIFNQACCAAGADRCRNEKMNQAGDVFRVIRHARWLERPEPKPHDIQDAILGGEWSREQEAPKCWKKDGAWRLEVCESQLRLLQNMSENYMRERAGQFWLLVDDLAYECAGFTWDKSDPEFDRRFKECAGNARRAKDLFEQGYRASGAADYCYKTKEMMMAYDFYSVIRHAFWLENPDPNDHLSSGTPIHECKEVPLIEVAKES